MKNNVDEPLTYEKVYEFDDEETCIRCAVSLECLIAVLAKVGADLPKRIRFNINKNRLTIRTPKAEVNWDTFIELFSDINLKYVD